MKYFLIALLALTLPIGAEAATLYLSPSSGSYSVGKQFTVSVYVASSDQAANAVSGTVSVPSDLFNIVSASSVGSIINFWVSQPSVSGSSISFEGVVLNPGYQGGGAKVASFTLSPKTSGTGSLSFGNASVLANDGQGTDILTGTTGASFTITSASAPAVAAPATTAASPAEEEVATGSAFLVTSTTHPNESSWYRTTSGTFSWETPANASATRLILSSSRSAAPSVEYIPAITQKTVEGLPEGISYLRVQHKVDGVWGGIGTYRVQIDTTPPERFTITFPHGANDVNPQPIIHFNTIDELSGISRYDVRVGEGEILVAAATADSNPYTLPAQEPGSHVVAVTAYDNAGNSTTVTEGFLTEGIDAPKITYYEEEIQYRDLVKVRGVTYPNASVDVNVYEDGKLVTTEPTKSNSLGDFATILSKRLEPGVYTLTARSIDARGARSLETEPVVITIKGNLITDIGFFFMNYPLLSLLVLLLVVGSIVIHVYGWRRLLKLTHGVHAQRADAAEVVHKAFSILKKDVTTHMRNIRAAGQKRMLTEEEIAFLEEFEGELEEAEQAVEGQMKKARKR